jgi:predicted TIM-barrel fold metal-dependent hydrolase
VEVWWREKFERMLIAAQKACIDRQVILGLSSNNEFIRELVDKHRGKLVGFVRGCCTDPKASVIIERFVKEHGFRGVKIHAEPNWSLSGLLSAHAIFLKATELDALVVIHSWHDEEGLTHEARTLIVSEGFSFPVRIIAELGRRYPDTKFVFAHMGGM